MSEILNWVQLLVQLGLDVWRAVESGNDQLTVGEILRNRQPDMDKIRELEDEARAHFGG